MPNAAWAQNPQQPLRFTRITSEQGLSQLSVTAIAQDARGFIWLGTQDGLNRYDGYEMQVFNARADDPGSLKSDFISALTVDDEGILWVGTDGGGVSRFDAVRQAFVPVPGTPSHVLMLFEDAQGALWVAGLRGLYRLTKYGFQPLPSFATRNVRALLDDGAGGLWIGTQQGLWRRDGQHALHSVTLPDSYSNITALAHVNNKAPIDGLWIGTDNGLLKRDAQGVFTQRLLGGRLVLRLLMTRTGTLWIGGRFGLAAYHPDGRLPLVQHDPARASSLGPGLIFSLFEDQRGLVWVGTHGGGVSVYVPGHNVFTVYRHRPGKPNSLASNTIMPMLLDSRGSLWVGNYNKGLDRLNLATGQVRHFTHQPDNPDSLGSNAIRALFEDSRGRIWVGTNDAGLYRHVPQQGFIAYPLDYPVTAILENPDGSFWVGTFGDGLFQFDPESGRFVAHYRNQPGNPASLPGNRVMDLLRDDLGRLWVATRSGLALFAPGKQYFTPFLPGYNTVNCIQQGPTNTLLAGTSAGVVQLDLTTNSIRIYNQSNGLASNLVVGLLLADGQYAWAATQRGLARINLRTGTVRNYTTADGLPTNEFNSFGAWHGHDGRLYFGSMGGVVAFDPQQIPDLAPPPTVHLTGLRLFNEPVIPQTSSPDNNNPLLTRPVWLTRQLTFNYQQDVFDLQFAALNYANPDASRYQYRLRGFSQNWLNATAANRLATYTNLDSGDYVFEVRAATPDSAWGPITRLPIQVEPAPWLSGWAYGVYTLALLLLLSGVVLFFQQRRDMRAAARMSELKSGFLAVLSHEIRTPLNAVLGMVQLLARTPLDEKQREYADTIRYAGDALLAILNDTLDYTKLEAGKLQIETVDFQLNRLIDSMILLMSARAAEKGLHLEAQIASDIPAVVRGDSTRLRQILLNLLSNAIKFTPRGNVTLEVRNTERPDTLHFCVRDTGPGIESTRQKEIFEDYGQADATISRRFGGTGLGLSICRRLVKAMGGQIGLQSTPGEGASFWFEIPLPPGDASQLLDTQTDAGLKPAATPMPRRILLVEDIAINQQVAAELLQAEGHQVTIAANGQQALDALTRQSFDVILMDRHMAVLDGISATQKIRALPDSDKATTPLIGLTASTSNADRQAFIAAGAQAVLIKPLKIPELRNLLAGLPSGGNTTESNRTKIPTAEIPVPDVTTPQLVDTNLLATHLDALGIAKLRDIKQHFSQASNDLLAQLNQAVASGDRRLLRETLHQLAGAAANLGLTRLAIQAGTCEEKATQPGAALPGASAITALETLLNTSLAALDQYLAEVN